MATSELAPAAEAEHVAGERIPLLAWVGIVAMAATSSPKEATAG